MLPTNDLNMNMCNNSTSNSEIYLNNNPAKIHINPNFCNIAALQRQPMQEEIIQPHINPAFLYRNVPKIHMNPKFFPTQTNPINATTSQSNLMVQATAVPAITTTIPLQIEHKIVEKNRLKIIRHPSIISTTMTTAATTTISTITKPATVLADTTTRTNKYKLDKRERIPSTVLTKNIPSKISYKPSLNKKLQTLNINGVIYKSTGTKLQRKDMKIMNTQRLAKKLNKRSHVNNAKQRSLQVLRQNLVKSNIPCPIFRRLGKCRAYEAKKCNKVHDKKYVIICRKFLNGECHNSDCLLSHDISLNKMPVCRYFLQANCVRDNCPYLHKKLNADALLCPDFLRGFCPLGDKCSKLHDTKQKTVVNIGDLIKPIKMNKKSKPILQDKNIPKKPTNLEKNKVVRYFLNNENSSNKDDDDDDDVIIIEDSDDEENKDNNQQQQQQTIKYDVVFRKRTKLGDLPAFIPIP